MRASFNDSTTSLALRFGRFLTILLAGLSERLSFASYIAQEYMWRSTPMAVRAASTLPSGTTTLPRRPLAPDADRIHHRAHLLAIQPLDELTPNAGVDVPREGQLVLARRVELPGAGVLLQKFLRQVFDVEATGRASRARGLKRG